MRRRLSFLTLVLTLALLGSAVPAQAGAIVPYDARPRGHSYTEWMRMVGQFFLGDASNPLITGLGGDCGQPIGGVFFLAAPIDVGQEFECQIPPGMPIVLSHAGFFTTQGIEGNTDEELRDAALAGFTFTSNSLALDGAAIPLRTIDAGVFDVISEAGSFYDVILGVGTGSIRTALVGNVVFLHPMPPGEHVIETEVTFVGGGGAFSATYTVIVG